METQVRTPQSVFMQPQRLIVPLFQRPYVWNEENQWAPLWADVTRLAERILRPGSTPAQPHFLGAVVLQQSQTSTGSMQQRTIIDGQQRLTTLQILLDSLHYALLEVGATQPALRVEALVANPEAFQEQPEDRFKVWPTNRDRPAFNEVMAAPHPIKYGSLQYPHARLVQAHQYFSEQARLWLAEGGETATALRAAAIERAARELLQIVVIDLTADENAQEIFETLNARGAQLTAADLIKNFIFQRLLEAHVDVEAAYEKDWKEFETGFWEAEINFGRLRYSRSSVFLNHWLIARTGEELVAREVFSRFKRYATEEAGVPMGTILGQLKRASGNYRKFVENADDQTGTLDLIGMFAYRTSTLESEVFKPLLLYLLDPELPPVPQDQLHKALEALESWLVRRMIVRATTKGYNQTAAELVKEVRAGARDSAGDTVQRFLAGQSAPSKYWPDDDEIRDAAQVLQAYRHLRRRRLRMLLEAVEDHRRGFKDGEEGLGGQRVLRGKYAIEHVMPRKWQTHWSLDDPAAEADRDRLIHTFGNLTLLTKRLNGKVSNGPWEVKRAALKEHDTLKLSTDLIDDGASDWTEQSIRDRTTRMVDAILAIWRVPEGHRSSFRSQADRTRPKVEVADLVAAGFLAPGATLYSRREKFAGRTATVLPDGRLDVDGVAYETPTGAARAIIGKKAHINAWRWFLLGPDTKRTLSDLWHEYVDQMSSDADEADAPEDDEDGDTDDEGVE